MQIDKIIVPVDFSADSAAALDHAIELAAHFSARIHVFHAYESFSVVASAYGGGLPLDLPEQIREAAAKRLAEWCDRVNKRGVECEPYLSAGEPSAAISDLAEQIGADLIVMGTRGLSGIMHVLMGSVAERTIRAAPCPVLTVKPVD